VVIVLSSVGIALDTGRAGAATPGETPLRAGRSQALSQDLGGATLEYVPGEARFDTLSAQGVPYSRVSVGGAVVTGAPGKPALPTATLHVGVPDGMSPRLRITSEDWNERAGPAPPVPVAHQRFVSDEPAAAPVSEFTIQPDPQIYGRTGMFPAQAASLGKGAAVGEMWVVPIHVRPVRWDPRARAYRLLQRMTLRVDFVPATDAERAVRPAFRPGGDVGPWRNIQESLIQNYESAKSFPIRMKSLPRPSSGARRAENPEFKISVTQTGWTSVSYAVLSGVGFPPGIAIGTVEVSERGYDDLADSATVTPIPVVARDNNANGTFDTGDAITFYGRSLEDRMGQGTLESRYSDANVYWVTWTGGAAAAPDTIPGVIAGTPSTPASFLQTTRMEQNDYQWSAPSPDVASPAEAVDYLFWTTGHEDQGQDRFQHSFSFLDPDTTQPFRVRSYYQGRNGVTHRLTIHLVSAGGEIDTLARNAVFFHRDVYVLDTGPTIPGSHMDPGPSEYRHIGEREVLNGGGTFIPGSFAHLNWIEVVYPRRYVARSNVLSFGSGPVLGLVELNVSGFTNDQIQVYDVTDPVRPARVTGVAIGPSGGGFAALFRTDASAGERRFIAFTPGAENAVAASSVRQDAPSALRIPSVFGSSNVARSILITPEAFLTPATRLADHRRNQGYVVEVSEIEDVYDEFNGGIRSPRAVRRYVRHGYLAWTPRPAYVLLTGDGSMDYKGEVSGHGTDWIPTYFKFETIPGPRGEELVAHESYYSLNLNVPLPGDTEFVPSVFLSRIPAGSAAELDLHVTKVIQYENFQPTDTWRGRQLLVADDEYSTGIQGISSYCFSFQEALFKDTNVNIAGIAQTSRGGADMESRFWDLKTFTDAVPPNAQECKQIQSVVTILNSPGGGYDSFASEISAGSLILNVQSHANRYLIAHEIIYCTASGTANVVFCTANVGPNRVGNHGKPTLLMVWGCHANQFADGPVSFSATFDSSDAVGEQWLLMDNRGAISSVGSTAYEYLHTNSVYNLLVADALYARPPAAPITPGGPQRSRWIVGEVFGQATIRNGMTGDFQQMIMNWTVNMLGDPMLRMDALPPRVYDVRLNGVVVADNAPLFSSSATDSVPLVARVREETAIRSVSLAERDLVSGTVTPIDSTRYSVAFTDSGRIATLTGRVLPRNENFDVQVRATDANGRLQIFTLQSRVAIRYLADGVDIVDGVFVSNAAVLRAEVTTPVPVTADSLQLLVDGVPVVATKSGSGRVWALEALPGPGPGTHTLQVAIGGRTAGFDQVSFQVSAEFTMRGVAVVSPRIQGSGCGGSVFQYELSAPADQVELLLLTVAGRRVDSRRITGNAGFNVYCWDGRDSQGHDTATGVYLYRLRATDASGRTVSYDGRMIRAR
jgi:hypothetical protein